MTTPVFFIGKVPITGRLILAPMDGFSDLPFRSICRAFGSAISYTSFVSAASVLAETHQTEAALEYLPEERPIVFQIFDDDEARLEQAAVRLLERRPDIIDINMGCSARCVAGRGAGAGLLRDPLKVGRIVRRLCRAVAVPVTAKIRLGWDATSRNYLDVARAIEDNGGQLIAVHGRTKVQGYGGSADWGPIAEIKAAVRIPVLGNGDVQSAEEAQLRIRQTGCDGVMIGRAAMGNPWIFGPDPSASLPPSEVLTVARSHLAGMLARYGDPRGVVLFRKHLTRYLDHLSVSDGVRQELLTAPTGTAFFDRLALLQPASAPVPAPPVLRPTVPGLTSAARHKAIIRHASHAAPP